MNFVKQPIGADISDAVSARGLQQPLGGRKWPIHYDSVEPLAILFDLATIVLASVFAGLSYHLQESGTTGDVGQSLGSAILRSDLFISLMKICCMVPPSPILIIHNKTR